MTSCPNPKMIQQVRRSVLMEARTLSRCSCWGGEGPRLNSLCVDVADDFGSDEEDNDFGEEEDEDGGSDYDDKRGKKSKKAKPEKPGKRGPKRKRAAGKETESSSPLWRFIGYVPGGVHLWSRGPRSD